MRITFISDTHEKHAKLTQAIIAAAPDVLVHCGDFTNNGSLSAATDFALWCAMLKRKGYVRQRVIVVAGNHDICLDNEHRGHLEQMLRTHEVHYLRDSSTLIDAVHFHGSPWTPRVGSGWAFQLDSEEQARAHWRKVPACDVLVTHGPPRHVLDETASGPQGDAALGEACYDTQPAPCIHAFGHIHTGHGLFYSGRIGSVLAVNAAVCDDELRVVNPPITVHLGGRRW